MLTAMRTLVLSLLIGLSAVASAETVTLVCTFGGKNVGTGSFSLSRQKDGSYLDSSIFKIELGNQKVEIDSKVVVLPNGKMVEDDEKELIGGVIQKNVFISFSSTAASVSNRVSGETKDYPAPAGTQLKDPSGLWFVALRPKIGDKSVATAFAADLNAWRKTERTYVSDKPFVLAGKKLLAHALKDETDGHTILTLVDDHGLPLDIEITGFHFVRK
jgi:hypothetical protein